MFQYQSSVMYVHYRLVGLVNSETWRINQEKQKIARQAFRHSPFSIPVSYASSLCCRRINHFAVSEQILTHNSALQQPETIHNRRTSIIQGALFGSFKAGTTPHISFFSHIFSKAFLVLIWAAFRLLIANSSDF